LRLQRFKGALSKGALARLELGLENYLEAEGEARPHLAAFLDAWRTLRA